MLGLGFCFGFGFVCVCVCVCLFVCVWGGGGGGEDIFIAELKSSKQNQDLLLVILTAVRVVRITVSLSGGF